MAFCFLIDMGQASNYFDDRRQEYYSNGQIKKKVSGVEYYRNGQKKKDLFGNEYDRNGNKTNRQSAPPPSTRINGNSYSSQHPHHNMNFTGSINARNVTFFT